jgi:hypothetical protein
VVGMETSGGTTLAAGAPLGSDNGRYVNLAGLDSAALAAVAGAVSAAGGLVISGAWPRAVCNIVSLYL